MNLKRWRKPFIIIVCIVVLIGITFKGYDIYLDAEAKSEADVIRYEREQYEQIQSILDDKKAIEEAELERIRNLNPYEKLAEGHDISILFIMNNRFVEDGDEEVSLSWPSALQNKLVQTFNAEVSIDYLPTSWSNTAWSWMLYEAYLYGSAYDLIYIDLGVNDINTLSVEDFSIFYEALVRNAIDSPAHVSLMIGNQLMDDQAYIDVIEDIGMYYSLNVFDVREVLHENNNLEEPTMLINGQPTSMGYKLYQEMVYNYIVHQTESHRDLTMFKETCLYTETRRLSSVHFNIELSDAIGFRLEDSEIVSNNVGDYLVYSSTRKYNLLTYLRHEDGGVIDVYVNNELYDTIDTAYPFVAANTIVIVNEESNSEDPMLVRIEVSALPTDDAYIRINSFSTN